MLLVPGLRDISSSRQGGTASSTMRKSICPLRFHVGRSLCSEREREAFVLRREWRGRAGHRGLRTRCGDYRDEKQKSTNRGRTKRVAMSAGERNLDRSQAPERERNARSLNEGSCLYLCSSAVDQRPGVLSLCGGQGIQQGLSQKPMAVRPWGQSLPGPHIAAEILRGRSNGIQCDP
jgi:hypothetical protein